MIVHGTELLLILEKIGRSHFKRGTAASILGNASVIVAISNWTANLALDVVTALDLVVPVGRHSEVKRVLDRIAAYSPAPEEPSVWVARDPEKLLPRGSPGCCPTSWRPCCCRASTRKRSRGTRWSPT